MAKSEILKQLVNNEITLEIGLGRLMIIASDIGNQELYDWAEKELMGYGKEDELPPNRILKMGQMLYSGINGSFQVTNVPLPLGWIPDIAVNMLNNNRHIEGIAAIQEYANRESGYVGRDCGFLAGEIGKHGVQCYEITMRHGAQEYVNMLAKIRTKLISVFIRLDKEFGNLDDLDVDVSGQKRKERKILDNELRDIIFYDNTSEVIN